MRLAIITTHPIQYYAPVFKLLHERKLITIKVFYTIGENKEPVFDKGFGQPVEWDVPLLVGYPFEWIQNTSPEPGSHHYKGIINYNLIEKIESFQAEAVLVFGWAYHSHLKAIRYFKGKVPVYFRGDSTLLDEKKGVKNLLKYIFLKWVYKHIDHAFYVGINNKAYFIKYGLNAGQLTFAPHAIDNERFSVTQDKEVASLRKESGINDNEILILFAGKFVTKKSPLLLLEAFKKLKKNDVHLLFVGNGELEHLLKAVSGNVNNIHFRNFQNQSRMPVIYQACDLFCLPSKGPGETWGLAVNEAMACNKAILVSDKVGCAADLVKEKYNGAIFGSENIDELTNYLEQLTLSKARLTDLGNHSGMIIKDWSFVKVAEAIENHVSNQVANFNGK